VSVKGDFSTLNRLKKNLRQMPISVAHDVAQRTAPSVTSLTAIAFNSGRSVYGDARPRGEGGRALTLRQTGATEREIRFVANGRIVRAVLTGKDKYGRQYAKYLIGKYGILPMGRIPAEWQARIAELVASAEVEL
jgi:hypothetical protein